MLIEREKNPLFTLWEFIGSSFEKTWMPFTQGCFVPRLFEIGSLTVVLEKRIILISSLHFCYFVIISPWRRLGPFIWRNLYPLHPRKNCQVWLKLAQWFWRRSIFNFVNALSQFRNYLPLEKGVALHLNKLEFLSPKDVLCQVWLK